VYSFAQNENINYGFLSTLPVRFNLSKKCITHTIFLGSNPLLFNATLRPGFPAAFATRQGVDASIWLQKYQPSRPDEWGVRHEGQLHAFGYVQASKEMRKYTACCPDLEYVAICETFRHVLVYWPRHDSAGGLRKRNGPPVTVGKQNLITKMEICKQQNYFFPDRRAPPGGDCIICLYLNGPF